MLRKLKQLKGWGVGQGKGRVTWKGGQTKLSTALAAYSPVWEERLKAAMAP